MEEEKKDVQIAVEGSIDAEVNKQPEQAKKEESIPLSTYLEMKKELKQLQKKVAESETQKKQSVTVEGLEDLSRKYPGVDEDFIADMLISAEKLATKNIENKFTPILEQQEKERKQASFDKAFDNLYNQAVSANPDLPKNIDKELIKELALTPKYRNVALSDILTKIYGENVVGKSSSENSARTSADKIDDIVSFDKITPDQKRAIMEDPKVRQKYFNWLDANNG